MQRYRQVSNISMLKKYFKENDFVVLAFLFGSRAKKLQRKISDWDIGVYFKPNRIFRIGD